MTTVRPLVVMAHGEPRFFCSCGSEMKPWHGTKHAYFQDDEGATEFGPMCFLWYMCVGCGSITQEIEVGAVASAEHVA